MNNKKIFTIAFLIMCFGAKSQNNNLTIIASGSGNSENTAINSALRSAIEKTFGVFISSNTTIQNDNLVSDEIASVSSGNIISYEIIDKKIVNSFYQVTLSAVLSPQKIVQSYKEKGFKEFELNGNVYAQNIMKEKFYKDQEPIVIEEFFKKYQSVRLFDTFQIKICEPFRFQQNHTPYRNIFDSHYEFFVNQYNELSNKNLLCGFKMPSFNFDLYNCTSFYDEFGNSIPCLRKDNELSHYAIPIIYTPIFNKNTAIELSKSLINFFNSISINDVSDYNQKFGDSYSISCIFPINQKGKNKTTEYNFTLRNLKSIDFLINSFQLLEEGAIVKSIYFEGFKPKMSSIIFKNRDNNHTVFYNIYNKKHIDINLVENKTGFFPGYSTLFSYQPSFLLLEVSEEELVKIVNLKILRNLKL